MNASGEVTSASRARKAFASLPQLLGVIRIAVLVLIGAVALATPGFLSWPSMLSLLTTVSFVGCVAVGMTLITVSGNIMSFSLGATVGVSAMIFVVAVNAIGLLPGLTVAITFGALISALQGLVIGLVRANSVIVSIASLSLIYGVTEMFAESGTVYATPGTQYGMLKGTVGGIPVEFITFAILALIGQGLLSYTVFGRNLFMMGSSFRAAEAVGARTWRSVSAAYAWAGAFTAIAGIMLAIRYESASMNYGVGYDYEAIAAVLVGGTAIKGGDGSVLRTLVGALVVAVIEVILLLQGFRQEWQYFISGLIVLVVIMLQTKAVRG